MNWDAAAAMVTAGATVVAVVIWLIDGSRARRGRARRLTARLELEPDGPWLVIRNGADAPAYDINVRAAATEAEPLLLRLLPPGQDYRESVAEELVPTFGRDSADLHTSFTMDERRWHVTPDGHLRGGRRDRPGRADPSSP